MFTSLVAYKLVKVFEVGKRDNKAEKKVYVCDGGGGLSKAKELETREINLYSYCLDLLHLIF